MFRNRFTETPHIRLYDKIILIVTLICTILICCFSLISSKNYENVQEKSVWKTIEDHNKQSQISIEYNFEKNFEVLEYLRTFPQIYNMDWDEQYKFLNGQENYLSFLNLFVMDMHGNGYYVQDGAIRNQAGEQFYEDVMTNNRFITEPFYDYINNRSITTLSVPIYKDNVKVGAICGTLNLYNIYSIFENLKIGANGESFIINTNGDFVAHNNMKNVVEKKNIFNNLYGDEKAIEFFEKSIYNNKSIVDEIKYNKKNCYVSFTPLKSTNWNIVYIIPKAEVLLSSNLFPRYQMSTIIFALILVLLSVNLLIRGFENHKLAYTDSLTKINNRAAANVIFKDLEKNKKVDVSLVCIDLNNFKYVNDNFGHQAGDILLCTIGKILRDVFHKYAFVARMGGDEFTIILVNKSSSEIEVKINEVKRLIDEYNKFNEYKLSISYGQASRKAGEQITLVDLHKKADDNMYADKSKNKNKLETVL